jgi:autotransporter-associated beta strand protein
MDGNLNADGAISGLSTLSVTGTSSLNGDVTSSSTQDYTGNVTVDSDITLTTTDSQITFTGTVNSEATEANDLTISVGTSEVEFDSAVGGTVGLGAIIITGDLDLDADITSATSLSVSADTNLAANVTTSGTQTYGDDAASDATVTDGSRTLQGSTIQFVSTVTGTTATTDDLTITGALNLDGAITDINDLYVSGTSDIGANITTNGTQEYNNNVTLSGAARTLTTSGDTVTFTGTVNGAQDLTVDTTSGGSSAATVQFASTVGDTTKVGAIIITGNLNLDGNIIKTSDSTAGATSLAVSGTSDLGADVTTTGTQQYNSVTTLSTNVTLTTTSNGTVSFGNTTDSDATDRTLAITTAGTGDVSFTGAVGDTGGLNGLTISTNDFNAAALTVGGTISITNTGTSSDITGVIANDGDAAVFTKAGTGTLTLSGTNTYTGVTTIAAGTLSISSDNNLGNPDILDADRLTLQGGTLQTTASFTLNTNRGITLSTGGGTVNVDSGTTLTYGGIITGSTTFTKDGDGILSLTGINTYTGKTIISNGTIRISGSGRIGNGASALDIAGTGTLDLQNTSTIGNLTILAAGTGERITNSSETTSQLTTSEASSLIGEILTSGINVIFNNTVTLTGNTVINSPNITFNSAVSGGAYNLDIGKSGEGAGNLIVNAEITNVGNLTVLGTTVIDEDISTVGNQIYHGAVTVDNDEVGSAYWTLTTTNDNITFNGTLNSTSGKVNNLTFNTGGNTGTIIFGDATADTVGATDDLGALSITGNLDLNAAVTSATSISVSGASNLGANITTSSTQTYSGVVTLSTNVILTTTDSNVTFNDKVISDSATNRNLTIDTNGNTGTVVFGNGTTDTVGVTSGYDLGVIDITGNLDLNAAIGNGATAGATSLAVSGTSNIGADITTTNNQTYTGAVTMSGGNRILRSNSGTINNISTINGGGNNLTITGNLNVDDAISNTAIFSVSGTSNLGANVTTSGTQTYTGAVTTAGSRTLQGSTIQFVSTVTGTTAATMI